MMALVYDGDVRLEKEYPIPEKKPHELLIRVLKAGICRTDLEIMKGYSGFKGILGHEFVGLVEEGPEPDLIGKRVVGEINVSCKACSFCHQGLSNHCQNRTVLGIKEQNGVFAQFVVLPRENIHLLPDSLSNDQAIFIEPLAAALQILEMAHFLPQQKIAVLGDGTLGLLSAQVLSLTGAEVLAVGRHREKLKILERRGIETALSEALGQRKFDVLVECTGSPSGLREALCLVRPRGTIVLKSTYAELPTLDLSPLVINEITLVGSRCGTFQAAIRLLESHHIDVLPLISQRFPLEKGLPGIEAAQGRETIKVLLEVSND